MLPPRRRRRSATTPAFLCSRLQHPPPPTRSSKHTEAKQPTWSSRLLGCDLCKAHLDRHPATGRSATDHRTPTNAAMSCQGASQFDTAWCHADRPLGTFARAATDGGSTTLVIGWQCAKMCICNALGAQPLRLTHPHTHKMCTTFCSRAGRPSPRWCCEQACSLL